MHGGETGEGQEDKDWLGAEPRKRSLNAAKAFLAPLHPCSYSSSEEEEDRGRVFNYPPQPQLHK
ncbi:hypothetical protein RvY_06547 [Ramazzottius varieornatus]|uniref:Uncharacterized protein n=1 Tax=Ramazzottius varieornatus TaxID=947166 RepID=A0A1D1V572_RAMVA|nr:hypothetical protein RvY_06547 [Ramazzottius varieornatus]